MQKLKKSLERVPDQELGQGEEDDEEEDEDYEIDL